MGFFFAGHPAQQEEKKEEEEEGQGPIISKIPTNSQHIGWTLY